MLLGRSKAGPRDSLMRRLNSTPEFAYRACSTIGFGDLSVRMRHDGQEPNGAEKQRPECIPVDPEHRSYSRKATMQNALGPTGCFRQ
jgi:hypothetical protein